MKQILKTIFLAGAAFMLLGPLAVEAQDTKDKKKEKNKDVEQIIITKKGGGDEKIVVEINGDKVTVNGKDVNDLKDDDIKVLRNKFKGMDGLVIADGKNNWNMNWSPMGDGPFALSTTSENRALLGVTTENDEEGVKITDVSEESAAEKAGLKEDDIITKIDDTKITNPDELTKAIRAHKPGDKVTVTYKRGKKENKTTAELGKLKGYAGVYNFDVAPRLHDMEALREYRMPRMQSIPRIEGLGQNFNFDFFNEDQRLGLSIQDTEDGKGVKVLEVDEESNAAKAGIKEGDLIMQFAGKDVNSADDVAKLYRENLKNKASAVSVQLMRNGKSQNVDIKIPRKLKTADL
ncbi:MAG: PDZ domain-containing protein [Terrimonas sp.]|nr:PDZ domain-containing protein [Terrimonas sp.]